MEGLLSGCVSRRGLVQTLRPVMRAVQQPNTMLRLLRYMGAQQYVSTFFLAISRLILSSVGDNAEGLLPKTSTIASFVFFQPFVFLV